MKNNHLLPRQRGVIWGAALLLVSMEAAASANAQTNLVQNGDFEAHGVAATTILYGTAADTETPWTFTGNTTLANAGVSGNGSGFAYNTNGDSPGSTFAFIRASNIHAAGNGTITQANITFAAAGSYVLSFDLGDRTNSGDTGAVTLSANIGTLNGGTVDNSVFGQSVTISGGAAFGLQTFPVNVTPSEVGTPYALQFTGTSSSGYDTAYIDNVSLVTAVPETATWLGGGFTLLVAAATVMRRKQELFG